MEFEVKKFCPLRKKKKSGERLLKKERENNKKRSNLRSELRSF